MSYILAIDQGTSSSRAVVFTVGGELVATGQQEFDCRFPADGWVEQDPETLWQTTLAAGRQALAAAGLQAGQLLGLGITNQRETTIVWDAESSRPIHDAIVWQDRRTADLCRDMQAEGMEAQLSQVTGLLVDPYFSSTKLKWILDNVEGARQRADQGCLKFGTVDSFLIWRLTRGKSHKTDATNASRTQLYDLEQHEWSQPLLDYFSIPRNMLPDVMDCVGEFGVCDAEWFGAEIPILGVAGDQQAALLGQACIAPGMTKSTYGTGCFVISHTGTTRLQSSQRLLSTVAYRVGGISSYALEGSIFVAGAAIKWLRDRAGLIDHAGETETAAIRTGGDTGGVYMVPAFTGLGAPHWEPAARGLLCGLTMDTTREQIITATLQSVGFQSAELLDAMAADGAEVTRLRLDGGMVVNDWLCQFLADILDLPTERPKVTETTALGAAMLAAIGAGELASLEAAAELWTPDRNFLPKMPAAVRENLMTGWKTAVSRTLMEAAGG